VASAILLWNQGRFLGGRGLAGGSFNRNLLLLQIALELGELGLQHAGIRPAASARTSASSARIPMREAEPFASQARLALARGRRCLGWHFSRFTRGVRGIVRNITCSIGLEIV